MDDRDPSQQPPWHDAPPAPASPPSSVADRPARSRTRFLPLLAAALLGGGASAAAVVAVDGSTSGSTTITESAIAAAAAPAETTQAPAVPITAAVTGTSAAGAIYRAAGPGVVSIEQANGQGSGFVIDNQGYILTNAHVIDSGGSVYVSFSDHDRVPAKVIGYDDSTDVGLLKVSVPSSALHPLPLGSSAGVQVGDPVVAIGNPFGLDRSVTAGIVSAVNRPIRAPNGWTINNAIQTDAAINHGNSGGPLLDAHGQVIAINAQIAASGVDANVGIGFSVPIDLVKQIAQQLRDHGRVRHGWLGVGLSDVDAALAARVHLASPTGVMVSSIQPGSPAARAGLKAATDQIVIDGKSYGVGGDIVTAIDGQKVAEAADLQNAIELKTAGERVTLTVMSASGKRSVVVTLGDQPARAQSAPQTPQQTPPQSPYTIPIP